MTPDQVKNDFQNINITQLNKAMKSVAETIIDTKRNFECLKNLSKKAIDRILKNFNSSQIHKFTILSEELASRGNLTAAKIWDLVEETPQESVQQHVPFY
uniref:Uncharacterized protein n=1 Tax=Euplotes crassus TaxID=5936 RepID=A0A7S3KS84_EUPCR|eukprot:CAMPEP_0197001968 /NCGR_PEP_ID=MMETSP1380-20130617/6543_1 /TAXON_ID=5936 /ORGANISM="Euplotes crassus, Strain CT5" /LENGTH=99 /DNA_ID=CAMNT_0042419849 /DNA_START=530 /DNA_END=829 /DNA_ORIENTATION=+